MWSLFSPRRHPPPPHPPQTYLSAKPSRHATYTHKLYATCIFTLSRCNTFDFHSEHICFRYVFFLSPLPKQTCTEPSRHSEYSHTCRNMYIFLQVAIYIFSRCHSVLYYTILYIFNIMSFSPPSLKQTCAEPSRHTVPSQHTVRYMFPRCRAVTYKTGPEFRYTMSFMSIKNALYFDIKYPLFQYSLLRYKMSSLSMHNMSSISTYKTSCIMIYDVSYFDIKCPLFEHVTYPLFRYDMRCYSPSLFQYKISTNSM